jgi:hypothetical protein
MLPAPKALQEEYQRLAIQLAVQKRESSAADVPSGRDEAENAWEGAGVA